MKTKIIDLSEEQVEKLEIALSEYDKNYIGYKTEGSISIGITCDGEVIAGLDACMTAFKILYISTIFVDERYRRMGYGKMMLEEAEKRAKMLGANVIRLDTFGWQGKDFYKAMNYEQVGYYKNDVDDYEEYFFLKRI